MTKIKVENKDPRELKPSDEIFQVLKTPTSVQFEEFDDHKIETSTWNFDSLVIESVAFNKPKYDDVSIVTVKLFGKAEKVELPVKNNLFTGHGGFVNSRVAAVQICSEYVKAERERAHDFKNKAAAIAEELDNSAKAYEELQKKVEGEIK